jgi:hypothetical protein
MLKQKKTLCCFLRLFLFSLKKKVLRALNYKPPCVYENKSLGTFLSQVAKRIKIAYAFQSIQSLFLL